MPLDHMPLAQMTFLVGAICSFVLFMVTLAAVVVYTGLDPKRLEDSDHGEGRPAGGH